MSAILRLFCGMTLLVFVIFSILNVPSRANAQQESESTSGSAQNVEKSDQDRTRILGAPTENKAVGQALGQVESAIKPIDASASWFDRVTLALGASHERLTGRTNNRFTAPNLGIFAGYFERIRGPWAGGVSAWLSSWNVRAQETDFFSKFEEPFQSVAPLRFFTHIEWAPYYDASDDFFDWQVFRYFRPSLYAGVGYVTFLEKRGWPIARREGMGGEAAARWGYGARVLLPGTVSLQLSFEKWRGVKTFDYTGEAVTLSVELGDVDTR